MILQLLFYSIFDFAVNIIGVFTFFSAGLLFLDGFLLNKSKHTLVLRSAGFFILSFVFLIYASSIQYAVIVNIAQTLKLISLILILISLLKEPILHKPQVDFMAYVFPVGMSSFSIIINPISSFLMLSIAVAYLRQSIFGLEKQLKPAAIAFFFLFFGELIKISFAWSGTSNVFWSKVLAQNGIMWNTNLIFQLIGFLILIYWVWGYIRFRMFIQFFTTLTASIFVIYLIVTFFFSFLLLRNLENDAFSHLKIDANVFQYALERQQFESLSNARSLAVDSSFKNYLQSNNLQGLNTVASDYLISQKTSYLTVTSPTGLVITRAEDIENNGDTLAEDPLVKSALSGKQLSTLISDNNIVTPNILIRSAVPIYSTGSTSIIGSVVTGFMIDDAFVDGVKSTTGLDATVFVDNKRSATTIYGTDGKSRYVGTLENNKEIIDRVLKRGDTYVGSSNVLNEPYYTVYSPLKTYGGQTIGMLFIGRPQIELLSAAKNSISITFLGSIILMVISIIPAFFIARFINENVNA